jgi:hypothetical protein
MRNVILKNITDKADALAVEYNKTKDPGIRDQWFELLKTVSQYPEPRKTAPPKRGRKKLLR